MTPAGRAGAFLAQVSSSTIMVCGDHKTVFSAALRGQKEVAVAVLQLPFFVPLRGPSRTKRSCRCRPAVAVLRAPSRPFADKKKLPLPSCSCRSAVAVLRAPSRPFAALRTKRSCRSVAVLQLPFFVDAVAPSRPFADKKKLPLPSCRCRSSCPFAALRALRGQKEVAVAVLQLPFSAALRGPSWTKRSCRCSAVAVLRAPSRPFVDKKKFAVPFCSCRSSCPFAALRGQKKEVAVAKKKLPLPSCSCRSSCPFAALRGQKEVAVAVLQLPCPFAALRGQKEVAVAVLQLPCPFAALGQKAVLQLPLPLPLSRCRSSCPFAALRRTWTKRSCRRCRPAVAVLRAPSRPFADKKKLPFRGGPSRTKRSCRCRSAVAVLRGPSRPFVDKKKLPLPFCSYRSPRPFVDQKGVPHDPPRTDHN